MARPKTLDKLVEKINEIDEQFFIIDKQDSHLLIGNIIDITMRIESSGNIFQPFGKNVHKFFPICFAITLDYKKSKTDKFLKLLDEFGIPMLHINKRQLKNIETVELTKILTDYIRDSFKT